MRRVIILCISLSGSLLLLPAAAAAAAADACKAKGAPCPGPGAAPAPAAKPYVPFEARVDDAALALSVAQALHGARVGGVQVEARNGRVVLKGVVDDAAAVARAKRAAQAVAGVREIEDRLVSAEVFEHD